MACDGKRAHIDRITHIIIMVCRSQWHRHRSHRRYRCCVAPVQKTNTQRVFKSEKTSESESENDIWLAFLGFSHEIWLLASKKSETQKEKFWVFYVNGSWLNGVAFA